MKTNDIAAHLRRLGRICASLTIVCGGLCLFCNGQDSAPHSVAGTVRTADGARIRGACVSAMPVESSAGNLACLLTDDEGNFKLMLRPGKYLIRAKYEAAGYPDPMFLLSADSNSYFPEIAVQNSDISGVKIILGNPGGLLEGDIRDAGSALPISGAKVTIADARNTSAYVEVFSDSKGHFEFTVPPKPVIAVVTAKGYRDFRTEEVALSGGQHRVINVDLQKR